MAIRALFVLFLLMLSACAAKRPELPPPPEQPTILIDDPKTCCDHPCIRPKATPDGNESGCSDPPSDNSLKPNLLSRAGLAQASDAL